MAIKEFARLRGANAVKLGDLDEVQCRAHTLDPAAKTIPAPIRQGPHIRLRHAVLDFDGQADSIGFIQRTVYIHGVAALVGDLKQNTVQTGPAKRGQELGFQVHVSQ